MKSAFLFNRKSRLTSRGGSVLSREITVTVAEPAVLSVMIGFVKGSLDFLPLTQMGQVTVLEVRKSSYLKSYSLKFLSFLTPSTRTYQALSVLPTAVIFDASFFWSCTPQLLRHITLLSET